MSRADPLPALVVNLANPAQALVAVVVRIGLVVRMALRAVGLSSVVSADVRSAIAPLSTDVLSSRNRLEMVGVDAGWQVAQVVKRQAVGDLTDKRSVDHSMCAVGTDLPSQLDDPVAPLVASARELPASIRKLDDAGKDTLVGGLGHAPHSITTNVRQH